MPIRTDSETLQQVIRLGAELRKDGECRVDISSGTICFRSMSEDHTAYLDQSVPISDLTISDDHETGNYWTELTDTQNFLNTGPVNDVTLTTATETPDSTIILQSNTVTYQYSSVASKTAHRVYEDDSDTLSAEPVTEFTLPNGVFTRALNVANLIGEAMRVQVNPDTNHVEFSASNDLGDSFSYSPPVDHIVGNQQSTCALKIEIERLLDVIPFIPPTTPVSLQLTREYLVYRAEFPVPDATTTLYIAERQNSIYQ